MLVSVFSLTTYSSLDNIVHLEAVLLKLGSIFGEKTENTFVDEKARTCAMR
jgi:hypothetical protein